MTNSILLTRHNQEIAQWSPDPFPRERVGSGHETDRLTDKTNKTDYLTPLRMRACGKKKVPVRFRPNAASGGWGYRRDFVSVAKRGYTRFDIILLNIHKTTSHWHVLRPRLLTFALLGKPHSQLFYSSS